METQQFSKSDAIKIQREHLNEWQPLLKAAVFQKLRKWATATNETESNPYNIRRGQELTSFLYKMMCDTRIANLKS